jgi:hypothetical protein
MQMVEAHNGPAALQRYKDRERLLSESAVQAFSQLSLKTPSAAQMAKIKEKAPPSSNLSQMDARRQSLATLDEEARLNEIVKRAAVTIQAYVRAKQVRKHVADRTAVLAKAKLENDKLFAKEYAATGLTQCTHSLTAAKEKTATALTQCTHSLTAAQE